MDLQDANVMTDLIIKSLKGTLTPEEQEIFDVWLGRPGNRDLYRKVETVWNEARSRASASVPDDRAAWKKISALMDGNAKRVRRIIAAAAACIAAFLFTGFAGYFISDLKHGAQVSEASFSNVSGKTVVRLLDGTTVWLRSGSEVSYARNFGLRSRTVNMSGEVFFDVAKDLSKPFRINISGLGIEVLGTSFDVKDCADKVVVSLVEGTVKLIPDCWSDENFSDTGDGIRIITSGETAYYRKSDSSISVDCGNAEDRSLWARDRIVFFNDDIVSVCRRLSVWYDVKITVPEDIDRKARLSFTVTDEPLDVILFLIRKASPDINYRYLEDGSVQIY